MESDHRVSVRHICDQIVSWQAPTGGVSLETCRYHRPPASGKAKAWSFGQDIPWLMRALYRFYDLTGEARYKAAADRYAVFFIACTHDRVPAWQMGGALDPCYTLYREHNYKDDSLDPKVMAIYRWLLQYRTENPNYFDAGYGYRDDQGIYHSDEDVGYSNDLSDVGRGLLGYYQVFKDEEVLEHATKFSSYFTREHVPGSMEGVWSSKLGTWLIGPRHNSGFENLELHADEAGWGFSAWSCSLYLARLYDCVQDESLKAVIRDRCTASLRWTFDTCQFEDGALGMQGRDDKWLGMTAAAIMQYTELYRRQIIPQEVHKEYYPKALRALAWLREMSIPERFPPDGYIPVTGSSQPDPGCNVAWLIAFTAEGLMSGPELESFGVP